jgi:hypothetical protein
MHLVKKCPSCSRKLRFPIDRGRIRVNCACGESFIADPDDTSLYRGATFDLEPGEKRPPGTGFAELFDRAKKRGRVIMERLIRSAYEARYRTQNFSLLPSAEQKKIVIALVLLGIALFALGYLICSPGAGPASDGVI